MGAELGGQGFHLLTGKGEGAGAVDFFGGVVEFLLEGPLGGDVAEGVFAAHTALLEALELLLRAAPGDNEAVELFVIAGFEEKSGFDKNGFADAFALPIVHLAMRSEEHT